MVSILDTGCSVTVFVSNFMTFIDGSLLNSLGKRITYNEYESLAYAKNDL